MGGEGDLEWGQQQWGQQPDGLMRTAIALLHGMTAAVGDCAPDRMSSELVMQGCVDVGPEESAMNIFRLMRRSGIVFGRRAGRGRGVPGEERGVVGGRSLSGSCTSWS